MSTSPPPATDPAAEPPAAEPPAAEPPAAEPEQVSPATFRRQYTEAARKAIQPLVQKFDVPPFNPPGSDVVIVRYSTQSEELREYRDKIFDAGCLSDNFLSAMQQISEARQRIVEYQESRKGDSETEFAPENADAAWCKTVCADDPWDEKSPWVLNGMRDALPDTIDVIRVCTSLFRIIGKDAIVASMGVFRLLYQPVIVGPLNLPKTLDDTLAIDMIETARCMRKNLKYLVMRANAYLMELSIRHRQCEACIEEVVKEVADIKTKAHLSMKDVLQRVAADIAALQMAKEAAARKEAADRAAATAETEKDDDDDDDGEGVGPSTSTSTESSESAPCKGAEVKSVHVRVRRGVARKRAEKEKKEAEKEKKKAEKESQ